MHRNEIFCTLISIHNHVITSISCMLSTVYMYITFVVILDWRSITNLYNPLLIFIKRLKESSLTIYMTPCTNIKIPQVVIWEATIHSLNQNISMLIKNYYHQG